MREHLMPYFEERTLPIEMIIIHCSAYDVDKCIQVWHEYKVAPHYVIAENGELIKMVDESKKAFHAGIGYWNGYCGSMNESSIGIELINPTMGQEDNSYTDVQIKTLMKLCRDLIQKYNIKPWNVVGHSDVAPLRKADPGRAFPWKKLAQNGIGLWYNQVEKTDGDAISLLQNIGYDVSSEEKQIASAYAFRRHYMQNEIIIEPNLQKLLDNPFPRGDKTWLEGENFIMILNAIACNKK